MRRKLENIQVLAFWVLFSVYYQFWSNLCFLLSTWVFRSNVSSFCVNVSERTWLSTATRTQAFQQMSWFVSLRMYPKWIIQFVSLRWLNYIWFCIYKTYINVCTLFYLSQLWWRIN